MHKLHEVNEPNALIWRYPLSSGVNTCRAFPCMSQYKTRGYIRLRQRFVCSKRNYTDSLNFNPASEQRNDKKTESPHVDLQSAVQRKQSTVRRITKRSRLKENTWAFSPFLEPASVYLSKANASILRWNTVPKFRTLESDAFNQVTISFSKRSYGDVPRFQSIKRTKNKQQALKMGHPPRSCEQKFSENKSQFAAW